ncbi:MAG TPA: hypothetical protein VKU40_18905 [Thermoanaerobaculia bacterium]|nr:hypothetical protein [Thermoanaerobaculia bacterium]
MPNPGAPSAATLPRRVLVTAGLFWLALAMPFALNVGERALDDLWVTYRYADHLVEGEGFVYNPAEPVFGTESHSRAFGTTAPGHGLLLAAVAFVTRLPVPWAGTLVTALALWATAMLLLVDGARRRRVPESLLAGTLLVSSRYAWIHNGAEAHVVLALLVAAAVLGRRRPVAAGLLAGFAVWCRPDAGLAVGLLGLLLWFETRRLPWRYGLAGAATIFAGLAAAWAWFGTPLPTTLAAKRTHTAFMPGTWKGGWGIFKPAFAQLRQSWLGPAAGAFVALGVVGQVALLWPGGTGGRARKLLALNALALAVAYPLLGVPFYTWYSLPVVAALLYGSVDLAGAAGRWLAARLGKHRPRLVVPAAVLLSAALLAPWLPAAFAASVRQATQPFAAVRYDLYHRTAEWIRQRTPADARLATVEVGVLGYQAERPLVDLLGLVTPGSIARLERRDLAGAFLAGEPDLFVVYEPMRRFQRSIVDAPWFRTGFREVARFRHPRSGELLRLYERSPGGELPAPEGLSGDAGSAGEATTRPSR